MLPMEEYELQLLDALPISGIVRYVHRTYKIAEKARGRAEEYYENLDLMEKWGAANRRLKLLATYNIAFIGLGIKRT